MSQDAFACLLDDLAAETASVVDLLAALPEADWELPTPAEGWSIRDQVSHLAFFDEQAVLAVAAPSRFRDGAQALMAGGMDFPDRIALRYREMPVAELRAWFQVARERLVSVFGGLEGSTRVPWFGPDMSLMSSATARLMETWAHGMDIADTLGRSVEATPRLKHIAHLGVRTHGFSFAVRGLEVPRTAVRVELDAPDGTTWAWGPVDAADKVTGPALDFCLVVTQRRHRLDTELDIAGDAARSWMSHAQAFAGAPSDGRAPRPVGAHT
ncbi:TIGR03084 family metal-binding protein [Nocardioides daejeonensis]|uniref:TIGR03084 family metal-binding protein n=1 Tax=Nocardioides daejeonensis TaxID=1046556 RepID=UPI000D74FDC3|nr:TIGR03084 family metal-binding protein [Nocardioides daejeonensis]